MGYDVRFPAKTNQCLWPVMRLFQQNLAQWEEEQRATTDKLQLLEERGSKGEAGSAELDEDGAGRAVSGRPRQTDKLLSKLEDNVKDAKVRLVRLRADLMRVETDEMVADVEVQEIEGVITGLGLDINRGYSAWCSGSGVNPVTYKIT
jgi:hypothetical protein